MTGVTQSPVTRHVNVPWSKATRASVFHAEQQQQQHADEQSPTSPQRNAGFQPRKGTFAAVHSFLRRRCERMFNAGLLVRAQFQLSFNGLASRCILHNSDAPNIAPVYMQLFFMLALNSLLKVTR